MMSSSPSGQGSRTRVCTGVHLSHMAAVARIAFCTSEVPLFHRRENLAPLSPRGSVNECSLSLKPRNGLSIGVGRQGGARILKNYQAGEGLSDHVVIALSCACPHKPFGLNLGQSTKKRGTYTSKESAASVVH